MDKPKKTVEQVARELGCYSLEAFEFLHRSLDYTVQETHGLSTPILDNLFEWMQSHGAELAVEGFRNLIEKGEIPSAILDLIRSLGGVDAAAQRLNRHVTGEQLCWNLRELAVKQWGLLAPVVLRHWGIRSTKDFGRMVFALVENDLLQKQPEDSIEDFEDVYDFGEVFDKSFRVALSKGSQEENDED